MSLNPAILGARILVVDDSDDNRYTLIRRLKREGYENIAVAVDGDEAAALIAIHQYDLVLLDVMMPKRNGYQVLEWLKAEGLLDNLPVIMISANTEIDSVVRCIELGAVDYLSKPFNATLLRARVGASLEKKLLRDEAQAHLARLEEELDAARQLQMSMLPTGFPMPTRHWPVDVFAMMEPAREVGGDLCDCFITEDGAFCFLIGDVSGKGVPAALFMARVKYLIRVVISLMRNATGTISAPDHIVSRVNRELCQDNASMMFVTLFLGILRPETGEVQFCSAGHNPPYHLSGNRVAPVVVGRGVPLGIKADSVYETGRIALVNGDAIYLFTDGITEASNAKDEFFTEERLETVLRCACNAPSVALVNAVTSAVSAFTDGAPPSDDITAMAIRLVVP